MSENPIVTTSYGKLKGGNGLSRGGKKYSSFSGIPYAEPPVGSLRFKPPVPHKGWKGVRDALKEGNPSIQVTMNFRKKLAKVSEDHTKAGPISKDDNCMELIGDEDCLYLNVFSPQLGEPLKPVMVYIHGGAFFVGSGSSSDQGPAYLMDHDVVLVTCNYRLGALGFLNLNLEGAAGNMGLKDQTLVLKWVKEEIQNFGGDPNNVTIFGVSAGGASVTYLMVSPLCKGLFHKAIAQSGALLSEWAFMRDHCELSSNLGKCLGSNATNEEQLLEYLMTVPAEKFATLQNDVFPKERIVKGYNWAFLPSIESVGENRFLSCDPYELVANGGMADVPFITGFCFQEGFSADYIPDVKIAIASNLKGAFKDLLFPASLTEDHISTLTNRVRKKYFDNEDIQHSRHLNAMRDFYGDFLFKMPAILTLDLLREQARQSPTFFYRFDVDSPLSLGKLIIANDCPFPKGALHGEDSFYLFNNDMLGSKAVEPTPVADKTIARMTKMWTNFAKSGDPSDEVKWPPLFSSNQEGPSIGVKIGEELSTERFEEFCSLPSTFKELFTK